MNRADVRSRRWRDKSGHGRLLVGVLSVLAAQLAAVIGLEEPASAATINVVYDPTVPGTVDPCSQFVIDEAGQIRHLKACAGGIDRTPAAHQIMDAAAVWFEDIFEDDHEVTIYWGWLPPEEKLPDAKVRERDNAGRPTEGQVRIPSEPIDDYFYDPTPQADEEFDMRPRLYRTTHPEEQARAFDGSPPEVLEVSYVGRSTVNDLLTDVLHEMGHALGLSGGPTVGPGPACDGTEDPYFRPNQDLVGGSTMGIKTFDSDKPNEQCVHIELGGIQECKNGSDEPVYKIEDEPSGFGDLTVFECASHQGLFWVSKMVNARVRPGVVDLLALAEAGGWEEVDFPRKYTAGAGDWATPSTWIGNRVPDPADDVYIVNTSAGTKVWEVPGGATAANLYISDANTLRVAGDPVLVGDRLTIAGSESTAGPLRLHGTGDEPGGEDEVGTATLTRVAVGSASGDGTLQAAQGIVEAGGALDLQNSASDATFGILENHGVILGTGGIEVSNFSNSARIRAAGGILSIRTPVFDPDDELAEPVLLDLDGPGLAATEIMAVDGDLLFGGIIADPVLGSIEVGPGRVIGFTNEWHQQTASVLVLDGTSLAATIYGVSQLDGSLGINGIGRFEDSLGLAPSSQVRLSIAGTTQGAEHDFLSVEGLVEIGGTLLLEVAEGYQPAPLDSFIVASYGSRIGEFTEIVGTELGGGLVLVPDYQDEQLVLVAGFAGAGPDDANCTGAAVSAQIEAHGNINQAAKFHGLSVKELQHAIDDYCDE